LATSPPASAALLAAEFALACDEPVNQFTVNRGLPGLPARRMASALGRCRQFDAEVVVDPAVDVHLRPAVKVSTVADSGLAVDRARWTVERDRFRALTITPYG
jgi:hypothetical protein